MGRLFEAFQAFPGIFLASYALVMKVSLLTLSAVFFVILSVHAHADSLCTSRTFHEQISGHTSVTVGYFQTVAPQGTLLFINGPEKSYRNSRSLIHNFCKHGFTVVAFDVETPRGTADGLVPLYTAVARKTVARIKQLRWSAPLMVYGWSKGAKAAVSLVRHEPKSFSRLILENPELNSYDALAIAHLPRRMTRVFACPTDGKVSFRDLKLARNAMVLEPAHASCGHQMSAFAEAQDPMVDFIESDFAGVSSQNWYWARKL